MSNLSNVKTSALIREFNKYSQNPVNKFSTRAIAEKRTLGVFAEMGIKPTEAFTSADLKKAPAIKEDTTTTVKKPALTKVDPPKEIPVVTDPLTEGEDFKNIRACVEHCLKRRMGFQQILQEVKFNFPEAKTNTRCISWYKAKMVKAGEL